MSNLLGPLTEKQAQYLAFTYTHVLLNRRPPAEADFQRFFCVTLRSVHRMILQLERFGLIWRTPRQAHSTEPVPEDELPRLQPIRTSVGD